MSQQTPPVGGTPVPSVQVSTPAPLQKWAEYLIFKGKYGFSAAGISRLNDILIRSLLNDAQENFIYLGRALQDRFDNACWGEELDFLSYVDELGFSMSWASRLMNIAKMIDHYEIPDPVAIGVTKLARLLPLARAKSLTQEHIEKARTLTDRDLREELGHKSRQKHYQVCPRCGSEVNQCPRCGEKI